MINPILLISQKNLEEMNRRFQMKEPYKQLKTASPAGNIAKNTVRF
jgi:hypothetical protein